MQWSRIAARLRDDAGHTMSELIAAMGVMSIAAALAVTAIVQAYHFADRYESLTTDQQELHIVFSRLDRTVRYATGISVPGTANGDWYVEYSTDGRCTQLRLNTAKSQLQTRTVATGGPLGIWTVLASHVGDPATFVRTSASYGGVPHQELQVALSVNSGSGHSAVTKQSSSTFVAVNTTVDTASDTVCNAMGRS